MGVFYMRHPVHGTKVATMQAEVDHDEALGWEQYDPAVKEVTSVPTETDAFFEDIVKKPRFKGKI